MFSRKSIQEALTVMYTNDTFDDIDFFVTLRSVQQEKSSVASYRKYDRFDITKLTDEGCKADFHFGIAELLLLAQALKIPESFVCKNGTVRRDRGRPLYSFTKVCISLQIE